MPQQPEFISPSQAGRRLGISGIRVGQLFDQGRLGGMRTALGRLIDASDVERLAQEREANPQRRGRR